MLPFVRFLFLKVRFKRVSASKGGERHSLGFAASNLGSSFEVSSSLSDSPMTQGVEASSLFFLSIRVR